MMTVEAAPAARAPVNLEDITDLDQAWRVCNLLAQSDIVPVPLRNKAANVLLVYMTGRELGLTFAQSLRTIYIAPGGSPQLRGALMLGLLRRAGHDYWFTRSEDGDACTCTVKRGDTGREYSATFSVDDALAAGLCKRNDNGDIVAYSQAGKPLPWMTYRPDMLMWRSAGRAANIAAPEEMMGFELMDYAGPQHEQADLKPAADRPAAAADERPQPAAGTGEDPAAELAGLDARGAAVSPGATPAEEGTSTPPPPARPEGAVTATFGKPEDADPRSASPASARAQQGTAGDGNRRASSRELQRLGEKLGEIGWSWGESRDQIAAMLTVHCRREIRKPGDLSGKECAAIASHLSEIIRKEDPEHFADALQQGVEARSQAWEREDPEGYAASYATANGD